MQRSYHKLFTLLLVPVAIFFITLAIVVAKNRKLKELLNEFDSLYPSLIDVSNDGEVTVELKHSNASEHLGIISVKNNKNGNVYIFRSLEPIYRVRLSPDGEKLSYFIQEKTTNIRRLYIWSITKNIHDYFDIGEVYAQPSVQWSPDSWRLAFNSPQKIFTIIDTKTNQQVTIPFAFKDFAWSNDGVKIIGIPQNTNQLVKIDAESGSIIEKITLPNSNSIQEVCWAPLDYPRVRASNSKDSANEIIDITSDSNKVIFRSNDGLSRIMSLQNGDLLMSKNTSSDRHFYLLSKNETKIVPLEGSVTPLKPSLSGGYYVLQITSTKYGITKVSCRNTIIDEFSSSKTGSSAKGIHTSENIFQKNFQLTFWMARNSGYQPRAAVIIISGGSDIYIPPERWVETQMYVNRGYCVIHVAPLKKSDGSEIVVLIDYLTTKYNLPDSKISIIGASTSASIAIKAVQLKPTFQGILVLTGVLSAPKLDKTSPLMLNKHLRVLAFHGEKDRKMKPGISKEIIVDALGDTCLCNSQSIWNVFDGEGHSIMNAKNRIFIIYSLLNCL